MALRSIVRGSILIVAAACVGCDGDLLERVSGSGRRALPVHVEIVVAEPSRPTLVASGIVEARSSRTLAFRVAGRIARFRANAGDRVAAGDAVAELDVAELRRDVHAARSALDRAVARSEEAERRQGRRQRLFDLAAASGRLPAGTRVEGEIHGAEVRTAPALLELAEDRLAAGVLRAPTAGVVVHRYRGPGDFAAAGAPVARLSELATVAVRASVPNAVAALIRPGGAAAVRSGGRELPGAIRAIDSSADPTTGSVAFEVEVANPALSLWLDTVVEITVDIPTRDAVCSVPLEAVQRGIGPHPFAFVAVGRGDVLRVERRELRVGGLVGDRVAVLAGLVPGERVVSRGWESVTVGDFVTIVGEGP